jgi:hypothetical protein
VAAMTPSHSTLPDRCAVAFKEWSGICNALADGRQSIIFRKGGIAEDRGQFTPEHRVFWLYPTHVHESQQGLRASTLPRADGRTNGNNTAATVSLSALVEVLTVDYLDRIELLERLAELHVWTDETVRKRFHYRTPGLWVLGVRAYRGEADRLITVTPAMLGCKTWVMLDEPLGTAELAPVLDEAELARRLDRLRVLIQNSPAVGTRKGAARNG